MFDLLIGTVIGLVLLAVALRLLRALIGLAKVLLIVAGVVVVCATIMEVTERAGGDAVSTEGAAGEAVASTEGMWAQARGFAGEHSQSLWGLLFVAGVGGGVWWWRRCTGRKRRVAAPQKRSAAKRTAPAKRQGSAQAPANQEAAAQSASGQQAPASPQSAPQRWGPGDENSSIREVSSPFDRDAAYAAEDGIRRVPCMEEGFEWLEMAPVEGPSGETRLISLAKGPPRTPIQRDTALHRKYYGRSPEGASGASGGEDVTERTVVQERTVTEERTTTTERTVTTERPATSGDDDKGASQGGEAPAGTAEPEEADWELLPEHDESDYV